MDRNPRARPSSRFFPVNTVQLFPTGQALGPIDQLLALDHLELTAQLHKVIPQSTTLLIVGETGTGKSRLARLIHDLSPRRDEPFLVVDCGSLAPQLMESELFGHIQGAFTGADRDCEGKLAAAGRGTLVFDRIGVLPFALQGKLLRVMDDRRFESLGSDTLEPFHARVIVVSNVSLEQEVLARRFRADLYYRLNVVAFRLPPLREKSAAIIPLANKFVAEFAARNRSMAQALAPEAADILERYAWPGNIRELRNTIERAAALAPGPVIGPEDLPAQVRTLHADSKEELIQPQRAAAFRVPNRDADRLTLSQGTEQVEILRITEALRKHRNNRVRAAAELGISRMSLYKKLHKYRLVDMPLPVQ